MKNIVCRICNRFKSCTYNMIFINTTCDTNYSTPCILIPIWSSKSGKSRYNIASIGILNFLSHIFWIFCRVDKSHLISEPLYRSTCNKDWTFKSIIYLSVYSPGNSCYKTIFWKYRCMACIHKKEATCSIGILCITCWKTGLTEKSSLLVTGNTCNRNLSTKKMSICHSINVTWRKYFRKHTLWDFKHIKYLFIPAKIINVIHHSSWCIWIICNMSLTSCKFPYKPCIYCTKEKISSLGLFSGTLNII